MQGNLRKKLFCLLGGWQQEGHRGTTKESSAQTLLWNGQAAHISMKSTPATAPTPVVWPLLSGCQSRRWTCRNQLNLPKSSSLPPGSSKAFAVNGSSAAYGGLLSPLLPVTSSPMGRTWDTDQWVTQLSPSMTLLGLWESQLPKLQRAPRTGSLCSPPPSPAPRAHSSWGFTYWTFQGDTCCVPQIDLVTETNHLSPCCTNQSLQAPRQRGGLLLHFHLLCNVNCPSATTWRCLWAPKAHLALGKMQATGSTREPWQANSFKAQVTSTAF